MSVDEGRRHELHERARRALGVDAGDTLMELLPPVGWADVATNRELELQLGQLRTAVQNMILTSEHRILFWMFTTVLAGLAIAVSVALSV